ncbi:hypothetical protein [Nonomuraea sp. NPDC002799]
MLEPEPTPADQWSRWDTKPTVPTYWPGFGNEHRSEGFEIDRKGVRVVAARLLKAAVGTGDYDDSSAGGLVPYGIQWALPRELDELFALADVRVRDFWRDLHAEVGMAGLLINRSATNYQLGDDPRLGDLPLHDLDTLHRDIMPGEAPGSVFMTSTPSELYPNGSETLQLPASIDYGVGQMTAEMAMQDIAKFFHGFSGTLDTYKPMADSLVELANTVQLRAQDLRDAPWRGEAADIAQSALRQIYANATALAAIVGGLIGARARFKEITDWCYQNFEQMADPDRSDMDDLLDAGDTADSRTRSFLEQANKEFFGVRDMMPKQIKEDLPGLMVTDSHVNDLRAYAEETASRSTDSERLKQEDADWQKQYLPILQGSERAEEKYG